MCFSQEMAGALALAGFVVGCWAWQQTRNWQLVAGVWYFVAMETLQFFQYIWLGDCESPWNKWLTVVGFLHICFQPYFTHTFSGAFIRNEKRLAQYDTVKRLCLIMGCAMFSRYLLYNDSHAVTHAENTDWLRGSKACTFRGVYHLAWEMPLHAPTYFMPSNYIHFFMMFAPYIALGRDLWLHGFILFATGPLLSSFITPNLYEQASIWCFFSIGQVCLATFSLYASLKFNKKGNFWNHSAKTKNGAVKSKGVKDQSSIKAADSKDD